MPKESIHVQLHGTQTLEILERINKIHPHAALILRNVEQGTACFEFVDEDIGIEFEATGEWHLRTTITLGDGNETV